jgi:hypothetical protein
MTAPDNPNKPDQPHVNPDVVAAEIKASLKTNSGNGSTPEADAPITIGEPCDAAALAINQKHMEDYLKVDTKAGVVECKIPPKATYFTVLPEKDPDNLKNRAFYFLLEPADRDPLLLAASIAEMKKDDEDTIRPILLVRYVTMAGEEGLWPLKLNPPDGRSNRWNTSANNALRDADEGKWVRLVRAKGEYRSQISPKTLKPVPPRFSERTFAELVNAAFPPDRVIRTLDHPIWEELANGRTK